MEFLREAFQAIPSAASSGTAAILYVVAMVAWVLISWRVRRNKNVLKHIEKLRPEDRLHGLEAAHIQVGLSPEQYLRSRIHQYYFLGFIVLCVTVISLFLIAVSNPTRPMNGPFKEILDKTQKQNEKAALIATMFANDSEGLWEAADKILKLDPNDHRALNMKGSVAFYSGQYQRALEWFEKAHAAAPEEKEYAYNLAFAYVEVGGYQRAIEDYMKLKDATPRWSYNAGRAYFHSGDYKTAKALLEAVPTSYYQGRARVLEAAALVGMTASENSPEVKKTLLSTAKSKLREAADADRQYWRAMLVERKNDIHESYRKSIELLGGTSFIKEVLSVVSG